MLDDQGVRACVGHVFEVVLGGRLVGGISTGRVEVEHGSLFEVKVAIEAADSIALIELRVLVNGNVRCVWHFGAFVL
jgi:hypothetical protein